MKLENFTSVPTETLRELIRFAKPSGVADFEIAFKNCESQQPDEYDFKNDRV